MTADSGEFDLSPSLAPAVFEARRKHLMTMIAEPVVVARPQPRRRLVVAAATLAVLTVGTSIGLTTLSSSPGLGTRAFAVTKTPSGNVAVRIVSTQASADEMTQQLHAAGLTNVSITTEAANPALVGTWVSSGGDGAAAIASQTDGYAATLEIPRGLTAPLILTVGRAAKPGEALDVRGFRNEAAPGGPLACRGLPGAMPTTALAALTTAGYTVDFWYTTNREHPLDPAAATAGTMRVTGVYNDDLNLSDHWRLLSGRERHVSVQVAPYVSPAYQDLVWTGFAPSLRTGDPAKAGC